jgi:hypothetical protein
MWEHRLAAKVGKLCLSCRLSPNGIQSLFSHDSLLSTCLHFAHTKIRMTAILVSDGQLTLFWHVASQLDSPCFTRRIKKSFLRGLRMQAAMVGAIGKNVDFSPVLFQIFTIHR